MKLAVGMIVVCCCLLAGCGPPRFAKTEPLELTWTQFMMEIDRGNIHMLKVTNGAHAMGALKTQSVARIGSLDVAFKSFKVDILGDASQLADRVWKTNPGIEIQVHND